MAPRGTIYPLTVSFDNIVFPYIPLLTLELRIVGSLVAPRQVHKDMLSFAAQHDVKAIIQLFPLNEAGIEDAMTKLDAGQVRYRAVLVSQE